MGGSGVRLVHAIRGRVRFKLDQIKGDPARAEEVRGHLSIISGIKHVEANPLTGSVLAVYDPSAVEPFDFHCSVASALGISLSEVEASDSRVWFGEGQDGSTPSKPITVSSTLRSVVGELNDGVGRLTGGVANLRDFVPFALFLLGVRSLLVTEKTVFPSWYDYFWFAFSTYFILNRAETPSDS
jgi:hypothetical protein